MKDLQANLFVGRATNGFLNVTQQHALTSKLLIPMTISIIIFLPLALFSGFRSHDICSELNSGQFLWKVQQSAVNNS